jgi:O-antigen/teichoic acid export membrane protein
LHALFWRTMKYLLAAMVPCVLLLLLFGRDALMFWMGPDFAAKVTVVMSILAIGTLLNGLGYFPSIALQSIGRPDVTAKLLMVETPIYLAMCYFLIPRFGIAGAAAAYSLRSTLDTVLLLFCSWKLMNLNFESARQSGLGRILVLTLMAAAASAVLYRLGGSFAMRLVGALTMIIAYAASIWYFAFLPAERSLLLNVVRVSKR